MFTEYLLQNFKEYLSAILGRVMYWDSTEVVCRGSEPSQETSHLSQTTVKNLLASQPL